MSRTEPSVVCSCVYCQKLAATSGLKMKQNTHRHSSFHCCLCPGPSLGVAQAYGFRSIQNIIRRVKRNKCPYKYIEIMACPKGCVNGGGQIRHADSAMTNVTPTLVEREYHKVP